MARDKNQVGRRAGFSDSKIPPAAGIVESAEADDLALECPADRTLVGATLDRARHPPGGYTPVRQERMRAVGVLRQHRPVLGGPRLGLRGGITRSLAIDPHGKSLSALMLTMTVPGHNEG